MESPKLALNAARHHGDIRLETPSAHLYRDDGQPRKALAVSRRRLPLTALDSNPIAADA